MQSTCQINNQKSKPSKHNTKLEILVGNPVAIYNFAASLFCTAPSLLRTVLDHGRWKLSQSPKVVYNCCIAFVVQIWSQLGRTILDLGSTTSTVASKRSARLRLLPRQTELPLHNGWPRTRKICRWPWNVKPTIRKAKPHKHNTKLEILLGNPIAVYNFAASLFCTAPSSLRTVWDHGRWKLSQSPKVVYNCCIAFVVQIWSQLGRTIVGRCQYNLNSGVHAIGKTTVAPKTDKTTTA